MGDSAAAKADRTSLVQVLEQLGQGAVQAESAGVLARRLRTNARRMWVAPDDAADAAQSAAAKLIASSRSGGLELRERSEESADALLGRVVRNLTIDELRSRKRRHSALDRFRHEPVHATPLSPEEHLLAQEERARAQRELCRALALLSMVEREALHARVPHTRARLQRDLDELRTLLLEERELADLLHGGSAGAAHQRHCRARKALRLATGRLLDTGRLSVADAAVVTRIIDAMDRRGRPRRGPKPPARALGATR